MASISLTASEIASWCDGVVLQDATGQGFQFDSRLIGKDEWFVVLQGARDGHDFLPMAQSKQCAGAIGQHMPEGWTGGFVQVVDSLVAFQQIAHGFRQRFTNPVVGVTGSAGKTTTRALIASVLEGLGSVHQTKGNFNNHIGVPKTITDASGQESAWVLEMGMSALGEIHVL
jgi:UDP-N-acetylmuramoyl-tripeptide--D-alanyl-D-alanine ligase